MAEPELPYSRDIAEEIASLDDEEICGPCPFPPGSAVKVEWLRQRVQRFEVTKGSRHSHTKPEIIHRADDERLAKSYKGLSSPSVLPVPREIKYRMVVAEQKTFT